jgi:hypothetical protein
MSIAIHPCIVADEIIHAIGKSSSSANESATLRIIVARDSKEYSKLKKELSDGDFHELLKELIVMS